MLTLQSLGVPIPEQLSSMFKANKKNTYSYLDKYKIFKKLVEYNLRKVGRFPNSNKEFTDITRHNWERKDKKFEEFIEEYTEQVNLCRQKCFSLNVKPFEPKNAKNTKKTTTTDIASVSNTIQVSNLFNGYPSTLDEQVVFIRDFDIIRGNKNMVGDGIQYTLGEQATNNQNFDINEGNINAVNEEEKIKSLFEELIDKNAYE
ncbi:13998_t:CDS:1 [Racocetra fulgida]|uniref:13998_t:CDS:1 n=1 Tax=Racocetra fulgida TaxID=60492 RepID=A0A9N9BH34_9GLOM|nr:13998_t:CDS:1 [Racocetra fulgida]